MKYLPFPPRYYCRGKTPKAGFLLFSLTSPCNSHPACPSFLISLFWDFFPLFPLQISSPSWNYLDAAWSLNLWAFVYTNLSSWMAIVPSLILSYTECIYPSKFEIKCSLLQEVFSDPSSRGHSSNIHNKLYRSYMTIYCPTRWTQSKNMI